MEIATSFDDVLTEKAKNGKDNDINNTHISDKCSVSIFEKSKICKLEIGEKDPEKMTESTANNTKSTKKPMKSTKKGKELRYLCSDCDYRTWKPSNLRRHLITHYNKICKLCEYIGKHRQDLKKHMNLYHSNEEAVDTICKLGKNNVIEKNETHTEEVLWNYPGNVGELIDDNDIDSSIYYCLPVEVCIEEECKSPCVHDTDSFPSFSFDEGQLKTNFEEKVIECKKRNNKELKFCCKQCNYKTGISSNYYRHLRIHSDERPYKCDQCKYAAKQCDTLKRHKLWHLKRVENGLSKTKKSLTKDSNHSKYDYETEISKLSRHKFMVLNENRTAACNHCSYTSKHLGNLKKHLLIHSDVKPFMCDLCDFKCRNKYNLNRHKVVHCKERPP